MINSATQAKSYGFENLMLPGLVEQNRAAAEALRQGSRSRPKDNETSPEEQRQIDGLKAADRRVRAHEQAHMAAGGELVLGGANYSFQTGPDKQRYAVAGDVSIDASPGRTPEETIAKAQRVRQAALAPADPSPQDRRVAAAASQMEMRARQELAEKAAEERARAGSERASQAIGAYQAAAGIQLSAGISEKA